MGLGFRGGNCGHVESRGLLNQNGTWGMSCYSHHRRISFQSFRLLHCTGSTFQLVFDSLPLVAWSSGPRGFTVGWRV